ncbi:MAG: hypothetical protein ABS76_38020 [Pelagibacterium sp. SCN 64-44]|nr:MAG: hypothetical protein ABS76_38020 [Pelagibacterium sp. SCN 64-44]
MAIGRRFLLGLVTTIAGTSPALAQGQGQESEAILTIYAVLFGIAAVIYLIPSWVAFARRHPNRWPIFGINLVFGGTGLGWIGSLIWACGAVHKSPTGSNGGESGLNLFVNDPKIVRVENPGALESTDTIEKLERLKRLHDAGVLSTEEYEGLRRPLVASLSN